MVQKISHEQEMKNLMDQQMVEASSFLKTFHSLIHKKVLLRVRGRIQQSRLSYQTMHQIILCSNHHLTQLFV